MLTTRERILGFVAVAAAIGAGGCTQEAEVGQTTQALTTVATIAPGIALVYGSQVGNVDRYLGIPYATAGRWRFPTRYAPPAGGTIDAFEYGPECPQDDSSGAAMSERCLTLNIWTPRTSGLKPVMVFIHGGAFQTGSAGTPGTTSSRYDGAYLAEKGDVVVVTIQYRVGVLGYLVLDELDQESGTSGNFGLLDQLEALRWVRDEIVGFGGDKWNVTVFGQSAGGGSTCLLIGSDKAAGLFHAAIIESGTDACEARAKSTGTLNLGKSFETQLGCSSLACMRAQSMAEIIAVQKALKANGSSFGPVAFGHGLLGGSPMTRIQDGSHNKVPVILGNTSSEMYRKFLGEGDGAVTPNFPDRRVYHYFNNFDAYFTGINYAASVLPAMHALYPRVGDPYLDFSMLVQAGSDERYVCPSRRVARALARNQTQSVRRYQFAHRGDVTPDEEVTHADELDYVFHRATGFDSDERNLSDQMVGYWTTFARTHSPNRTGLVTWPAYVPSDDNFLRFADWNNVSVQTHLADDRCDAWDDLN